MIGFWYVRAKCLAYLTPIVRLAGRPGRFVTAIASISFGVKLALVNASFTTLSMFCLCKSAAIGGIMPPYLRAELNISLPRWMILLFAPYYCKCWFSCEWCDSARILPFVLTIAAPVSSQLVSMPNISGRNVDPDVQVLLLSNLTDFSGFMLPYLNIMQCLCLARIWLVLTALIRSADLV